jgi:hypothetical protein
MSGIGNRRRKDKAQKWNSDIYDDDDITEIKVGPLVTTGHFESMVDLEIEEDNVDLIIDSVCADLWGFYSDCAMLKESPLVRRIIRSATSQHKAYFQALDCTEDDNDSVASSASSSSSSNIERADQYDTATDHCWANTQRKNMKATQEPLRLAPDLCDFIRGLPERDVTLYIRLDEQVPKDSCTAYEVDWNLFHNARHQDKSSCFRIFRWCSRKEKTFSRTECIAGTFASACMHPYTLIVGESGTTITTKSQRAFSVDDESDNVKDIGPPTKEAPFRPIRLLLDRPEDVCTAELRYYFTRMGVSEVHEVQSWLRELHDTADLDFFPDDPTTNNELLEDPYTDILHSDTNEDMPSFLAGNIVDEVQVKTLGEIWDSKYTMSTFWNTNMPFICMDEPCSELLEMNGLGGETDYD